MKALAAHRRPEERASSRPKSSELEDSRIKRRPNGDKGRPRTPCGSHRRQGTAGHQKRPKEAGQLNTGSNLSDVDPEVDSSSSSGEEKSSTSWRSCGPGTGSTWTLATFPCARCGARLCLLEGPCLAGDTGRATRAGVTPALAVRARAKAMHDHQTGESHEGRSDERRNRRREEGICENGVKRRSRRRRHEMKEKEILNNMKIRLYEPCTVENRGGRRACKLIKT